MRVKLIVLFTVNEFLFIVQLLTEIIKIWHLHVYNIHVCNIYCLKGLKCFTHNVDTLQFIEVFLNSITIRRPNVVALRKEGPTQSSNQNLNKHRARLSPF